LRLPYFNTKLALRIRAGTMAFSSESLPALDAGWLQVRVKKTQQIKNNGPEARLMAAGNHDGDVTPAGQGIC
jgi:hypothetical protein